MSEKLLEYNEFVKQAKKQGVTNLYREVTVYSGNKQYNNILYALKGSGRSLVGYYAPSRGGVMKSYINWSARDRKFEKIKI